MSKLRGLAIVLAWASQAAWAQSLWTFDQVAAQALAGHPAILSKRSALAAAQADLDAASWQRYPTPSLERSRDNFGYNTLVRVQQPLWAGGRITAGIDAAQSRRGSSGAGVDEAKQDVLLRVIAAYVEAVRQQARQDVVQRSVTQHEALLDMIARRVEVEASSRVDRDLARSRLYQTSNELSEVTQALSNALVQLSQLAGSPVGRVVASLDPQGGGIPASREEVVALAEAWSPTLKRLALDEEAATADIDSRRAAYSPQVALRYDKSYGAFPIDRVFVVFEAQPGAGLSSAAGVDGAVARREAVRRDRETALRDLLDQVSQDWNTWAAARARLENARLAALGSTEVYESYARQYTTGRKSWLDVMNAVREAAQSELAVADAAAQATAAALRLRVRIGRFDQGGSK